MRIFNLNENYNVVCNWKKTRNGFKHEATLHKNGFEIAKTKCCYLNRTWECFEYESVLVKIINENFDGAELKNFLQIINNLR